MRDTPRKHVLVIVDADSESTYLILKNLVKSYNVTPLYINCEDENPLKRAAELKTIHNIITHLNDNSSRENDWEEIALTSTLHRLFVQSINIEDISTMGNSKAVKLILGLFTFLSNQPTIVSNNRSRYDEIQIVYSASNRDAYVKEDMIKLYETLQSLNLSKEDLSLIGIDPTNLYTPLTFPLERIHRGTAIKLIRRQSKTLSDLNWSCEKPVLLFDKATNKTYLIPCDHEDRATSCPTCRGNKAYSNDLFANIHRSGRNTVYRITSEEIEEFVKNIQENSTNYIASPKGGGDFVLSDNEINKIIRFITDKLTNSIKTRRVNYSRRKLTPSTLDNIPLVQIDRSTETAPRENNMIRFHFGELSLLDTAEKSEIVIGVTNEDIESKADNVDKTEPKQENTGYVKSNSVHNTNLNRLWNVKIRDSMKYATLVNIKTDEISDN
jgi:hypothetical protein